MGVICRESGSWPVKPARRLEGVADRSVSQPRQITREATIRVAKPLEIKSESSEVALEGLLDCILSLGFFLLGC
jgi:hypothetical protein